MISYFAVVRHWHLKMKIRENFYSWDDFAYNLTACNYSYIQLIDFNARFYSLRLGIDQFSTDRLEIALRIVEGRG